MKIIYLVFILTIPVSIFAGLHEGNGVPVRKFKTLEELNDWAGSTAFGGGSARMLILDDEEVFFTDRMFSSGIMTSELIFFVRDDNGYITSFLHVPVQAKNFWVDVVGEEIHIKFVENNRKLREQNMRTALRITKWMLPWSTRKAEQASGGKLD